jgi:hypothetical protein
MLFASPQYNIPSVQTFEIISDKLNIEIISVKVMNSLQKQN